MSEALVDSGRIAALVQELALKMEAKRPLLLLPIMTGAMLFCADLLRCLPGTTSVKPIVARREGIGFMPPLREHDFHCDLWVIDNTICSGLTLHAVLDVLPAGTRSVVLFGLPCARRAVHPSLIGVELQWPFVAGYGADFSERMRGLPELRNLRGGS